MFWILWSLEADVAQNLFLDIVFDGYETEDVVFSNICVLLPTPLVTPPDKDLVPAPAIYQVLLLFSVEISRSNLLTQLSRSRYVETLLQDFAAERWALAAQWRGTKCRSAGMPFHLRAEQRNQVKMRLQPIVN